MKISFGESIRRTDSGKHKFLARLAIEFKSLGIDIVGDNSDVHLHIGRNIDKKCKLSVMRLDGLLFNTRVNYKKKNKKILDNINKSDSVVYQNEFCKEAYEKFLGIRKPNACISNGANPNEFGPRGKIENLFVAACKWRPHKRLEQVCSSFVQANNEGLDSDLYVFGDTDYKVNNERIHFLGWSETKKLNEFYSKAIASFHISWLDWCPNSMVESIVAGCPVIYTNSGGHKYIATGCGSEIEDRDWSFKACDLYDPPKLDERSIIAALFDLKKSKISVENKELHIRCIAEKYIQFFKDSI
jgi:glycosyltransferase involved in cell wall biosynthesis